MSDLIVYNNCIDGIKWYHKVTDNTFNENESEIISSYFKNFDELHSEENWIRYRDGYKVDIMGYSAIVFFPNTSRWTDIIQALLDNTCGAKKFYGNKKDYMVALELAVTKPKYKYDWHVDVPRKAFTGVCYWGNSGEGTILKSKDTQKIVEWKHNRAVWFGNYDRNNPIDKSLIPMHKYENNSDNIRATVNINFTPQQHINEFLTQKKEQLDFWLKNKTPLWAPMVTAKTKTGWDNNGRI